MENTGTALGLQKREKHIYRTIAALLQYIYSIIAAHFNSSTITTHFSTVTAYFSTFTAHFSTF